MCAASRLCAIIVVMRGMGRVLDSISKDIVIVVADDYSLTRDMIRAILKQLGFSNVLTAENGKRACEIILGEHVDLVICDWNMPGMTGLEVLRTVRNSEKTKDLPFLMLTAEAYRENVVEAVKAGVTDYIAKPFTSQTLSDKLETVFSVKKRS